MLRTKLMAVGCVVVVAATAFGCSQRYAAERDGKKIGQAMCDLRNATNQQDAKSAMDSINRQLDDLGNKYAVYTAEDRKDVQNNLADLSEHSIQGNTLLRQQDLVVLQRSVQHIVDGSDQVARAAWEGVLEGLADCTQ